MNYSKIKSVVTKLKDKRLTITTVESCTGGRIASVITSVPGASQVFAAGFVTYQTWTKSLLLNVNPDTIDKFDVVSQQVVVEMVKGGCEKLDADIALATTGYAGPDGGNKDIPVGTIWIGCGNAHEVKTLCLHLDHDRDTNLNVATQKAIDLLADYIDDLPDFTCN
jgi:nicotinamide-nucleotide amidase